MQDLINKIENQQDLSNHDLKKLKFANKNIKDSSAYQYKCKNKIFDMVNQHGNFHIFRTQSYNNVTWKLNVDLLESKKDIIHQNPTAMLALENFFFKEAIYSQKKNIFQDLLGWNRWASKIEFQKRG